MNVFLTVHEDAVTPLEVFHHIAAPLVTHDLGWKQMKVVDDAESAQSVVMLTPNSVITTMFPSHEFGKTKLSVCDMKTKQVWLNEDRWRRNLPDDSALSLPAYRAYMIQHELGHALGHEHAAPCSTPGEPAPVMLQQTLGIGVCSPNPFPIG